MNLVLVKIKRAQSCTKMRREGENIRSIPPDGKSAMQKTLAKPLWVIIFPPASTLSGNRTISEESG